MLDELLLFVSVEFDGLERSVPVPFGLLLVPVVPLLPVVPLVPIEPLLPGVVDELPVVELPMLPLLLPLVPVPAVPVLLSVVPVALEDVFELLSVGAVTPPGVVLDGLFKEPVSDDVLEPVVPVALVPAVPCVLLPVALVEPLPLPPVCASAPPAARAADAKMAVASLPMLIVSFLLSPDGEHCGAMREP